MAVRKKNPRRSTSRPKKSAATRLETINASDRELLGIPKSEWTAAKRKERIVKMALRSGIEPAADVANCSTRTIRRLVASYRIDPSPLAFLPRRPGPKPGGQRLDLDRESIVTQAVEQWKASPEPLPVERAFQEVKRLVNPQESGPSLETRLHCESGTEVENQSGNEYQGNVYPAKYLERVGRSALRRLTTLRLISLSSMTSIDFRLVDPGSP
jgi:hypothetical protein